MIKATENSTPIPSRRALLAGAPAVAAAALAGGTVANAISMAKAAEVDPIFAAIERERTAYAAYLVTSAIQSQVSDQNPFPAAKRDRRAEKKRLKSPEHKAWWARYQEAEEADRKTYNEMCDARVDFLRTQPTSVAGLRAFIDHIDGPFSSGDTCEALWDETEAEVAFPTLADATRNIIARGQV